jgi:hypothetical protein
MGLQSIKTSNKLDSLSAAHRSGTVNEREEVKNLVKGGNTK